MAAGTIVAQTVLRTTNDFLIGLKVHYIEINLCLLPCAWTETCG